MSALSVAELDRARRDPVVFAEMLIGEPLFDHQVSVVRSTARYRCLLAGRRSGKTRVFGVLALHGAFSRPRFKALIVSASDTSAKRMFADVLAMAMASEHLNVSIQDDTTHLLTLSNGSTIECVPASMKAVRAAEADLLIVDEAGFVDQEIWEAAEPVVGARRGARVLIASTPWRGPGHFLHDLWRQGMDRPDSEIRSWHWPSTVNPMLDLVWLESVKGRSSPDYFAREYEAAFTSDSGAYFTEDELMSAVADYQLFTPKDALEHSPWIEGSGSVRRHFPAVAGLDWGMARDSNAIVLLSPLDDLGLNDEILGHRGRAVFIPYLEARPQWPWNEFIEHIVGVCSAFDVQVLASETNGVGAWPTDDLAERLSTRVRGGQYGGVAVSKVWTDVRRKQSGFAKIKGMLQRRQLVLPSHPELLKQLRGLEFEQLPGGSIRIAVPERSGHDDLGLALLQAMSAVEPSHLLSRDTTSGWGASTASRHFSDSGYSDLRQHAAEQMAADTAEFVRTPMGLSLPREPRPDRTVTSFATWAQGAEKGEGW